MTYDLTLLSEE